MDPEVLVCDEPVSALDVSVQAQILNLIEDMKDRYALTILFISHDLSVVKNVSDRVVVMYLGKICEIGPVDAVFHSPAHPYTRILIDSMPEVDPDSRAELIPGDVPSPLNPPSGCRFRTRCPRADERCREEAPVIRAFEPDHFVACHHVGVPVSLGPASAQV
jgi:peptide/nickel transport system ATP-binding protein